MHRKTNIWVWILPLALLSMVFFYSSKVGTILLPSVDNIEGSQGVRFHGKITNAPKSVTKYDSYVETEIPIVNNSFTRSSNYRTESSSLTQNTLSNPNRMGNDASVIQAHDQIVQTGNFSNIRNSNLNSGIGLSGMFFENKKNSSIAQASKTPGFSSLSEDLNPIFETSNRQSAGGVDPGGDPTDPALPLGDGFWFLLILAFGYLVWKYNATNPFFEN